MSIKSDIQRWSREVLEVPNKHLNGFPACPHAKQAWKDDAVEVVETDYIYTDSMGMCSAFSTLGKDVVVVASYTIPDIEEFNGFIEALNHTFPEIHCMQFHPEYGPEDADLEFLTDNEWESDIDAPYCMIFIQSLEDIVRASDKLEKLGYYSAYPEDEYQALVVERRERFKNLRESHDRS